MGLAVLIQYRRVTDTHPATQAATQTRCRSKDTAYYVARVKIKAARFGRICRGGSYALSVTHVGLHSLITHLCISLWPPTYCTDTPHAR